MGANISVKSIPGLCPKPCVTTLAFWHASVSSDKNMFLSTVLQPSFFALFGSLMSSQILSGMILFASSYIAFIHSSMSEPFVVVLIEMSVSSITMNFLSCSFGILDADAYYSCAG